MKLNDALRHWISKRACQHIDSLTDETPVLDAGFLTSLDVLELVLFVETETGREINLEALQPESIRTISTMVASFG